MFFLDLFGCRSPLLPNRQSATRARMSSPPSPKIHVNQGISRSIWLNAAPYKLDRPLDDKCWKRDITRIAQDGNIGVHRAPLPSQACHFGKMQTTVEGPARGNTRMVPVRRALSHRWRWSLEAWSGLFCTSKTVTSRSITSPQTC